MKTVKIKIIDFDPSSNNLIVCAGSDVSKRPLEEYQPMAYQPTAFEENDPYKILQWIAKSALIEVQRQARDEEFAEKKETLETLKSFVGKEFEYDVDFLMELSKAVIINGNVGDEVNHTRETVIDMIEIIAE